MGSARGNEGGQASAVNGKDASRSTAAPRRITHPPRDPLGDLAGRCRELGAEDSQPGSAHSAGSQVYPYSTILEPRGRS